MTARDWEAARDNRRMRRQQITGEGATSRRAPVISRASYPPTPKQYDLLKRLCEQHGQPYVAPVTRQAASDAISALIARGKPKQQKK